MFYYDWTDHTVTWPVLRSHTAVTVTDAAGGICYRGRVTPTGAGWRASIAVPAVNADGVVSFSPVWVATFSAADVAERAIPAQIRVLEHSRS